MSRTRYVKRDIASPPNPPATSSEPVRAPSLDVPLVHDFAKLIARGTPAHEACAALHLDALVAASWLAHPEWPALVRAYYVDDEWVRSQDDELLPHATRVYRDILTSTEVDPRTRLAAARDIYERKGHASTARERVPTMTPPAPTNIFLTIAQLFGADASTALRDITPHDEEP